MRRREFIALVGGAIACPVGVRRYAPRVDALRAGLRDLGYIEGQKSQPRVPLGGDPEARGGAGQRGGGRDLHTVLDGSRRGA